MNYFRKWWLENLEAYFSTSLIKQIDSQLFDEFIKMTGIKIDRKKSKIVEVQGVNSDQQIYETKIGSTSYLNFFCWVFIDRKGFSKVEATFRWYDPISGLPFNFDDDVPDTIIVEWIGFNYSNYREEDDIGSRRDIRFELFGQDYIPFQIFSSGTEFEDQVSMTILGISAEQTKKTEKDLKLMVTQINDSKEILSENNIYFISVRSINLVQHEDGSAIFEIDLGNNNPLIGLRLIIKSIANSGFSIAKITLDHTLLVNTKEKLKVSNSLIAVDGLFPIYSDDNSLGIDVNMDVFGITENQAKTIENVISSIIYKRNLNVEQQLIMENESAGLVHSFYLQNFESEIASYYFDMGSSAPLDILKEVMIGLEKINFGITKIEIS